MQQPNIYLKIGDEEEFNPADCIKGLKYLGVANESSSPQWTNLYQDYQGRDGSQFLGQTLAKRTVNEPFFLHFGQWQDFQLAKHEIYRLFADREKVRVRTDVNPDKVYFGYVTPFDIAPLEDYSHEAKFTIPFDVPDGYRYSRYRSDAQPGEGQYGMDIANDLMNYHFTSMSFRVYNASDITIDPYYQSHDLRLLVTFEGNSCKVTNSTTNTEWRYLKSCEGKQLLFDGKTLTTYENGKNVNVNTNYGYISLKPGWNEITVSEASSIDITFSFPFIYVL
ncbi:hypothetical protein PS3_13034 [Limosilactobacillus gastricus PS3]|uniref:Siphovirus-type tail component RIFT-related domain-containing protein n=1 Tax=Limosilactobacillus gastricus PS3 TaxID=1144300 RepID=H4GJE8_9LACO|nr:phage tail domain-containing protein [Limosilactobacillus gastricus]EHS86871.1 hypothetical protein PS3_13034 [Limosilactobacillus gastricus PS3]